MKIATAAGEHLELLGQRCVLSDQRRVVIAVMCFDSIEAALSQAGDKVLKRTVCAQPQLHRVGQDRQSVGVMNRLDECELVWKNAARWTRCPISSWNVK